MKRLLLFCLLIVLIPIATIEEANTYFNNRFNATAWTSASTDDKARALLQATKDLETIRWIGDKYYDVPKGAANHQALQWPRNPETRNLDLGSASVVFGHNILSVS